MYISTKSIFIFFIFFVFQTTCSAQSEFYSTEQVSEIKIYFTESDWDAILDSLYVDGNEARLLGSVKINGTSLDSVGIRYKGFSSASVDRDKNPFNIKLDYVLNQTYNGIDKIKLSNVIQDPSFVREVLSYEIARKYMPASQANFSEVYINDVYWGLYTNVEAVNKEFLQKHYHSSDNVFFKCNPSNLDLTGENANLSDSPGIDSTNYFPLYDLKSDYGWTKLLDLIDTLNNNQNNIESILNVDRALWMHAFNYCLVNFDSYVGYGQNYYLYEDNTRRFSPIIWDLNMSFASFRNTDASENYSGFSVENAKTLDPLSHYNSFSVFPRPLLRKLFENDQYRRMYLAHIRTINEENFINQDYLNRAQSMQNLIDIQVQNDTNKFYTYDDFLNNLTSTVTDLIEYPGISDLMDNRAEYLSNYSGYDGAPTFSNLNTTPTLVFAGDSVWINVEVDNANTVILAYRDNNNSLFEKVNMFDDGLHNDGAANDQTYGYRINNISANTSYYIYAENDISGIFSPERAAYQTHKIEVEKGLVINEILAINTDDQTNEFDNNEDWIELYNNSQDTINLVGYYLSDNFGELTQWEFPDTVILPESYLIIWADNESGNDNLHCNFNLSSTGEGLYLSNSEGTILDEAFSCNQSSDISFGRLPNGVGEFQYLIPTYSYENDATGLSIENQSEENLSGIKIFPNPTNGLMNIHIENGDINNIVIFDIQGRPILNKTVNSNSTSFDCSLYNPGIYLIRIDTPQQQIIKTILIQ